MPRVFAIASEVAGLTSARNALTDATDDSFQTQVNRRLCDALATAPGQFAADWNTSAGLTQSFCRPYYLQNGDTPPSEQAPFQGGQCPGVEYQGTYRQVTYTGLEQCNENTLLGAFQGTGPVSLVGPRPRPGFPSSPGQTFWECRLEYGDGGRQNVFGLTQDNSCPAPTFEMLTISRVDGQADNCGNPPGELQPPPNYSRPADPTAPISVTHDGGQTTNININTKIDASGEEYIEITTEGDSYTLQVSPDGDAPVLPTEEPPAPTEGTPVEPVGDTGDVQDDITEQEEDEGFETVGYKWRIIGIPSGFSGIPNTSPRIFPTTVGNVQLRMENEGGLQMFSDQVRILTEDGLVLRQDSSFKVKGVRYNHLPELGGIRLTPIRVRRTGNDS